MRRIDLPPHSFWVRSAGEGTPVVLLHGLAGSSRWWDRNIDSLAREHAVHAIELVGFGRSGHFAGSALPLSFEEAASLLARWLRTEIGAPVHLVGHSMGGHIAIELAARAPDVVRSLTLVGSTGIPFTVATAERVAVLMRRPPPGLVTFAPRLTADALRAGPAALGLGSVHTLLGDARDAMARVHAPALLVWGDSDPLVPLRYAERMRDTIPRAELHVIERAGHIPMWDRPEKFNALLRDFLERVEAEPERTPLRSDHFSWAIADCAGGICWRTSGPAPRVVLVHGLGIGSRYFRRLAAALHARGIHAAAPDLPGIAFSAPHPSRAYDPAALAERLVQWKRDAGIGRAVWVGHSTGCQIVDHVARAAPGEVAAAIHVGPIWTERPLPWVRLPALLARDALHEPWSLIAEAVRAYWESGLLVIFRHTAGSCRDLGSVPSGGLAVAGDRDPLVDRDRIAEIAMPFRRIEGGHGAVWSHPEQVAAIIAEMKGKRNRAADYAD